MIWRKDKPEIIGEYVIIVPAFTSPQNPEWNDRPSCTCSVYKAWFDGQRFIYQDVVGLTKSWDNSIEPGKCLWAPMPEVFMDGWNDDGINISWREQ